MQLLQLDIVAIRDAIRIVAQFATPRWIKQGLVAVHGWSM